ncbi:TldD/PmbA family protein [Conexibacter sp. SYSU D00693]|uniref:TldD/PmbA family protein n=1 Tax=Conexibacter sp. SYSU D00693 TaxID=2812560 RepID=UPI00196AF50D|nr:metallopeptidase TldD-related protein [Conexibacter sp. SYSU D00693]
MSETPLELADRALGHLGDEDGQATVTRERSLLARFARSRPTQATQVEDLTVHVLVLHDGHPGTATTNRTDDEALRDAAARAKAAAAAARRAAGAPGDHPGLPAPPATDAPEHAGFDAATAQLDAASAGAALGLAFERCAEHGVEAFGAWTAGDVATALASSRGVRASDRVTDAHMKVIARDAEGRSGWGAQTAVAAADVDPDWVARRALEKLPREAPIELGPGSYDVVLDRDAVGGLLEFLGWLAFDGLAHIEGRGAFDGKLGSAVAAPSITITDDPFARGTLPRAFDLEGTPKAPLALVDGGVARAVVHDSRSAARAGDGARSTGHALAPGGAPGGPMPTNLALAPGDAADEHVLAAPIERGLYVNRLWYLNVVHPKQVLLTGTTRDGTFLIEDGRITRPVRDVRFTDSVLRLLSETEQLGAAPALTTEGDFYGRRFAMGTLAVPLRARGLRVTG